MKITASYQVGYFPIQPGAGLRQKNKSVAYKRCALYRMLWGGGQPPIPCSHHSKALKRLHFMPALLVPLTLSTPFQTFQGKWGAGKNAGAGKQTLPVSALGRSRDPMSSGTLNRSRTLRVQSRLGLPKRGCYLATRWAGWMRGEG